jgi:hypothetical protein
MRTAAVVAAAEGTHAWLGAEIKGGRQLIDTALHRADEPGELLAYWVNRYGRNVPKPVKRGIADAITTLYTEFSLLKYDTASHGFRFGDVIDLCHPKATEPLTRPWQGALYEYALDRRHGRDKPVPELLGMIRANAELRRMAAEQPDWLTDRQMLKDAGMTWEDVLSLAGDRIPKARLWEALIPSMGYMALLRNLRNFDQAGITSTAAGWVQAKLADPREVARSRQFPMRFLAAYQAADSRWYAALEVALRLSLANVPELPGRTLILVDRSGSMFDTMSARTGLNRADTAAIFGTALAMRNHADLIEFGTGHRLVPFTPDEPVLTVIGRFGSLGGTNTAEAVRANYAGHDRVVILTDEQAWGGWHGEEPTRQVPAEVPVYTWNLAGYKLGHGPAVAGRWTFGGLSDASFRLIPLLEAGPAVLPAVTAG